jgi:predicted transcriptional regulator
MRDLANDQKLDPPTVSKRSLAKAGMTDRLIDEEIKLKKIYMEVCDGKPVDIKKLRAELEAVMEELEEDVAVEQAEEEALEEAEQEFKDVDMLKDFEKTLGTDGVTTPEQNKELMREITQIMQDLAKDPKLDPTKVNKRSLRTKGLSATTIDEEMKLKKIYDEVALGKPVGVAHLRAELDDVMYEMELDAQHKKDEVAAMQDTDKTNHEKHDIDKLHKLEDALGGEGLTTEDQDYAIMCEIRDIMRDIAHDPKLEPLKTTKVGLKKKGKAPREIEELMKLKHIYEEVADGKPVDIKHLRAEMDEVMAELAADIQQAKSQKAIKNIEDKMDDINVIKDLEKSLGTTGFTTKAQDDLVKEQIATIMRDLANDPTLDPPTVTKRGLAKAGLNSRLIDEEMKLKKIYMEVAGGKPVDIKKLRAELDAVIAELAEDAALEAEEVALMKDAATKNKDASMLRDFENTLGTTGETTPEQNKELMREITQIMRDLARDQTLDPTKVT